MKPRSIPIRSGIVTFCVVAGISACATSYQQFDFSGGYSERQTGESTFDVTFRGNAYTELQRASDFAMLRSAEVALDHGCNYFSVVSVKRELNWSRYTAPVPAHVASIDPRTGEPIQGIMAMGAAPDTQTISKPVVALSIRCRDEAPDPTGAPVDAAATVTTIKHKYGL